MATNRLRSPVVLDTTVLSNLAHSDDIVLLEAFDERIVTVPAVIEELRSGIDEHDHVFLTRALDTLAVVECEHEPGNNLAGLDLGETHALHAAQEFDGSIATDDRAARSVAKTLEIPVTGSLGVLVRAVHEDSLDRDDADERLQQWRNGGYHSPVTSITELLPDD